MLKRSVQRLILAGALLLSASGALAATQKLCVWDFVGANGDITSSMRDYVLAMQRLGVYMDIKSYTDEHVAIEDFKTGQCDGVMATGIRLRPFNGVSTALDSLGSATILRNGKIDMNASFRVVHDTIKVLADPKAASLMVNGDFEVAGISTVGPAYPMVNDRHMDSVEALAGKRMAAMDYDKAQANMIQRVGGQPVSVDILSIGPKFNNGALDFIALPAQAYRPLELYKGVGAKGAVVRFPVLFATVQLIIRRSKFPEGFGEKSRQYWVGQFAHAQAIAVKAEDSIPANAWLTLSNENATKYTLLLRESRIDLAKNGMYNKTGLRIIKKVRCSINPSDSECTTNSEVDWN